MRPLALVALLGIALSGCGGGGGDKAKPLSDRQAIAKLWREAVGSSYGDFAGFCRLLTRRMVEAAKYTGSASTCAKGLKHNQGDLPTTRLRDLSITGSSAAGRFREGTGNLGRVGFAKEGGEWKIDGLTYFVSRPSFVAPPRKPKPPSPEDLHTAEGKRVASVLKTFYAALEDQDTAKICENITPDVRRKAVAIGSIQDAKTCPAAYRAIFHQLQFSYTTVPTVVQVKISGDHAKALSTVGRHKLRAPLRRIGGDWKVNSLGG